MPYEDLVVQLVCDAAGRGTVQMSSGAGETHWEEIALEPEAEAAGAAVLARALRAASRDVRRLAAPEISDAALRSIGSRLFHGLFQTESRLLLERTIATLGERSLRLRFQMDPAALRRYGMVPWEFLYDDRAERFLALRRDVSIVRHIQGAWLTDPPQVWPPLSILAVASDAEGLDLEGEIQAIAAACDAGGGCALTPMRDPTLDMLGDALHRGRHNILHLMGHGDVDPSAAEGILMMWSRDGERRAVSGHRLGEQLLGARALRLVVLNACWSANSGAATPFAGVATSLVDAGVPAVVGMQFAISDRAARVFSTAFYRGLARGDAIDTALAGARLAIHDDDGGNAVPSPEWATPVLFQRLTSGQLAVVDTELESRVASSGEISVPAPGRAAPSLAAPSTLGVGSAQAPLLPGPDRKSDTPPGNTGMSIADSADRAGHDDREVGSESNRTRSARRDRRVEERRAPRVLVRPIAAVALAAALGWTVLQWTAGPPASRQAIASNRLPGTATSPIPPSSINDDAHRGPTAEPARLGQAAADRATAEDVTGGKATDVPAVPSTAPFANNSLRQRTGILPAPAAPAGGSPAAGWYMLRDGQTQRIRELDTEIAARFVDEDGQALLILRLTPRRRKPVEERVTGRTTLDLRAAGGRGRVTVEDIDWDARELTLRAAPGDGATAQCRDGSFSYSTTSGGSCSMHGGIEHKIAAAGSGRQRAAAQ